jgi:hypothetical protein
MPNLRQFTDRDSDPVLINLDPIERVIKDGDHAQIWVGGHAVYVKGSVADIAAGGLTTGDGE